MKSFIEEYSFAILAAIIALILILMCTPVGRAVWREAEKVVEHFKYEKTDYTLTLVANGGTFKHKDTGIDTELEYLTCDKNKDLNSVEGCILSKNTPVKQGYDFVGWFTTTNDREETKEITKDSVLTEDTKIFAKWKRNGQAITDENANKGVHSGHLFVNGKDLGEFKQGTVFTWKGYSWTVLKISNNSALVISTNVYGSYKYGSNIKYNESNIVNIINDLWTRDLDSSTVVKETSVSIGKWGDEYAYTLENSTYRVFAPSYSEVKEFLDSDSLRIAYNENNEVSCWWTRTAGEENSSEAYAVSENGILTNRDINDECGVRYAMYVNLLTINDVKIIKH